MDLTVQEMLWLLSVEGGESPYHCLECRPVWGDERDDRDMAAWAAGAMERVKARRAQ